MAARGGASQWLQRVGSKMGKGTSGWTFAFGVLAKNVIIELASRVLLSCRRIYIRMTKALSFGVLRSVGERDTDRQRQRPRHRDFPPTLRLQRKTELYYN